MRRKDYKWIAIIAVTFLFVIVLWIANYMVAKDCSDRGTFGDLFGAVNALFSGLAFAGVIIALFMQRDDLKMQRKELELQRKELEQTNEELKGQKKEFEEQNKTLRIQRFENTLFNMLSQQQEITDNLHYKSKDGGDPCEAEGRAVFDLFYNTKIMEFAYGDNRSNIHGIKGLIIHENNIQAYHHAHDIHFFDLYFRHLYRIFKYIDESPLIEDSDRYGYAALARAQLSEYELLMLFYNTLNNDDGGKFKTLIEKYAILNNIRKEKLAKDTDYNQYYHGSAYQH